MGTAKRKLAYGSMVLLNIIVPIVFLIFVPLYYGNHWSFFLGGSIETNVNSIVLIIISLATHCEDQARRVAG